VAGDSVLLQGVVVKRLLPALVGLASAMAGCSGCTPEQPASSAQQAPGADAGADADAAPDSPPEGAALGGQGGAAGQDAGGNDAGNDAGAGGAAAKAGAAGKGGAAGKAGGPTAWGGWQPLNPEDTCPTYLPLDLAAAVPPLTWSPCPAASGCSMLDTPWWTGGGNALSYATNFTKHGSGAERLSIKQWYGDNHYVAGVFATSEGGSPIAAWGHGCGEARATVLSLWQDQALTVVIGDPPDPLSLKLLLFWGSTTSLAGQKTPSLLTTTSEVGGNFGESTVGDGMIAWRAGLMTTADKQVIPLQMSAPQFAGKDLFFLRYGAEFKQAWVRTQDGTVRSLVKIDGVHVVGFATDGITMAWLQASKPQKDNTGYFDLWELWAAPYTTDPASLSPSRVAIIPELNQYGLAQSLHVGAGHIAVPTVPPRIYRVSDKAYYSAPSTPVPDQTYFSMPFVDDQELVALMTDPKVYRTVVRIKLASMELHTSAGP
jgi:hypothetical protein